MTHAARRYRLVVAAVCLIYGTSLLHPPRVNSLEPLTTAVLALSFMSSVLSLFVSGADLTAETVRQNREFILHNRELIGELHKRFDNFGKAMEEVLHKLDALPEIIRQEIIDALDEFQQDRVLGIIRLIVEDFVVMRAGGQLSTDPRDRLMELQNETRVLMQRGDLNAPLLLVGMSYELALLKSLGAGETEVEERTQTYTARLLEVVSSREGRSLYSQFLTLRDAHQQGLTVWRHRIANLAERYDNPPPSTCAVEGKVYVERERGGRCGMEQWTWEYLCTRFVENALMDELNTQLTVFRGHLHRAKLRAELARALWAIIKGVEAVVNPGQDLFHDMEPTWWIEWDRN